MPDDNTSCQIVRSKGRHLIDAFWGNYVALIRSADSSKVYVLKDPAGVLPCFIAKFRGVTVLFSRMADCVDLNLIHFSVNYECLRDRVMSIGYEVGRNSLNEVSQLYRGQCIVLARVYRVRCEESDLRLVFTANEHQQVV
jgi:asparagine synthase (glutamine-hydrolysing)